MADQKRARQERQWIHGPSDAAVKAAADALANLDPDNALIEDTEDEAWVALNAACDKSLGEERLVPLRDILDALSSADAPTSNLLHQCAGWIRKWATPEQHT